MTAWQVARTKVKYRHLYPVARRPRDPLAWARQHAIIRTASGTIVRYADVARDYQDAILADPADRIIVAKSRQIGISQVVAFIVALEGVSGGTALVVSRTGDQAVKFLHYVRTAIVRLGVAIARDNQTSIAFANGGGIEVQAATRGAGRGIAATLVVLDEMAWMEYGDEIYTAVTPTLAETGGRLIILSSVKGRTNLFARLWFDAQDAASPWSPHFLPWHVHPAWRAIPDWPARKKDADHLTDEAFAQEYDVDFLRSGGEVFEQAEIDRLFRLNGDAAALDGPRRGHRYVSGFDIGRRNDAFVGFTFDVGATPFRVVAYERHLNLPYPRQAARIEERARLFPGPVFVESNGVGDPLIEFLRVPVTPFVTTAMTKRNALDALKLLMQRGELVAPELPQWRRELSVYAHQDKDLVQDCIMAAAITALAAGRPVRPFSASVGGALDIPPVR